MICRKICDMCIFAKYAKYRMIAINRYPYSVSFLFKRKGYGDGQARRVIRIIGTAT